MEKQPAVSEATLTKALAVYAGMVGQVLDNPQRWLGGDDEPDPDAGLPGRALDAVKDRTLGEITPASPQWAQQPLAERVDWWVDRIGVVGPHPRRIRATARGRRQRHQRTSEPHGRS